MINQLRLSNRLVGTPGAWHTCYKVETDTLFQICIFHDGCKQGIDQQIFNRKL